MSGHDFSSQAKIYATFRPSYPEDLFFQLRQHCHNQQRVWDVGTGNGQAALSLTKHFQHIIATDCSFKQLVNAKPHNQISYIYTTAESAPILCNSIDLITVAQALHWFQCDQFFEQAKRVLKPQGIIAVWCYQRPQLPPKMDPILDTFYHDVVGPYWPPERRLVDTCYASIAFPFANKKIQKIMLNKQWTLKQFLGYLRSWSACKKFQLKQCKDPVSLLQEQLATIWDNPNQQHEIQWQMTLMIGNKPL